MNKYVEGVSFKAKLRQLAGKGRGVSEIIGTMLMIAITLIAGAAIFGWVNGQAGLAEGQYGQSVANNVNYLNEHFEILNAQFPSSSCTGVVPARYCTVLQVSIYNTGIVALSVKSITITGSVSSVSGTAMYVLATQSSTGAYTSSSFSTLIGGCKSSQYTYTYATTEVISGTTTTVVTSDTATTTAAIPQNMMPPAVFTITLPQGFLCPLFLDGSNYQVQVLGSYGNVVTLQATASG